ncbi:alkene reductase [Pollutimonas harenae]|uniref:Alkene reductase n=1 Tax=Pollutimonas harenae TaxID=657015 RepID=A0A853H414_9BURK|nr:alkene reductase [Pollutimonas harenae]NYT85935.1 alkene reductase [Pollutimonas harenae]TEA70987.1 alkene reductase [Pollutimonas harenae]
MVGLFDSVQLGSVTLANRIVMSPLTRNRASEGRIPNDLMRTYYCQRATAGLILSEATSVSPQGVGYANTPGIWSSAQVEGWKKITQAVHDRGGKIFMQLWHVGRVSDPEFLNGEIPVAPSAIACEGPVRLLRPERPHVVPRALHIEEIPGIVADFAAGARKAREAGFDGVEVHAANGYLIDQFLRDSANKRCDAYGGSIENRTRLLLEVVDACIGIWGAGRVGVHLSPQGESHSVSDSNPGVLFSHVARVLGERGLAFLFIRESQGPDSLGAEIKRLFRGPVIFNQEYDAAGAQHAVHIGKADAVAFGKAYIANPDLVARLKTGAPLNEWDESTFYTEGGRGYTDYPCLSNMAAETCV